MGLDSGFGCIPSIVELGKPGWYATAVIKKKAYWPAGTDGQKVMDEMSMKPVGSVRVRKGTMDGQPFYLAAMADSKHTSLMLSNWTTTQPTGPVKKRRVGAALIPLQLREYQQYYYYCRHAVDDNNNNRQGTIPFEESFSPKRWDLRQFGFILALCVTNAMLGYNSMVIAKQGKKALSNAEFRRMLAEEMLKVTVDQSGSPEDANGTPGGRKRRRVSQDHKLKRLKTGNGKWQGHRWSTAKQAYQKYRCCGDGCTALIRTYCACDKSLMLCTDCYAKHVFK